MSGRKSFDEEEAIDRAMMAFWRRGYEATSVCELEQATGLNKSSLYNAFESKEGLFVRCLDRYMARHGKASLEALDAPGFEAAIDGFYAGMLRRFNDDNLPRDCLTTMTAMAVVGGCDAVAGRVGQSASTMQDALAGRIDRAKADGELPATIDSQATAALLSAVARGISVLDRSPQGRDIARLAIRGVLAMVREMKAANPIPR
jgi:AcrR family transcriptional regulator